jgi:hypothetical protein
MAPRQEIIETTAGEVTAELKRRGVSPDEPVTVTLDLDRELVPGRREARVRVVAAGLSDDDIDRLIKEARREANEERRQSGHVAR